MSGVVEVKRAKRPTKMDGGEPPPPPPPPPPQRCCMCEGDPVALGCARDDCEQPLCERHRDSEHKHHKRVNQEKVKGHNILF